MKHTKQAFTLVELIVVITILAILGTIAFMMYADYAQDSRDSVRATDIWIINQSLWVYEVHSWKFPVPTDSKNITYSWAVLWYQWKFWDTPFSNLDNIDKKPVDPLFNTEYDYSVINIKTKYQIWTVFEWDTFWYAPSIQKANAVNSTELTSFVSWNYDHNDINAKVWNNCSLITAPSMFVNNASSTGAIDVWWEYNFVYDKGSNVSNTLSSQIDITSSGSTFKIYKTWDSCSVDTYDELNLYISKLSLAYQQLHSEGFFNEVIYTFNTDSFRIWAINNLETNRIYVNPDILAYLKKSDKWNIFKDGFTKADSTQLLWGSYETDTLWTWESTGALVNSSYITQWNTLLKNDANWWILFPSTLFPITSIDKSILFDVIDFSGWSVTAYSNYIDDNNYLWITVSSAWYIRFKKVWWVYTEYENIAWAIDNDSLIEFVVEWNTISFNINGVDKWDIIDLPITNIGKVWLILSSWTKIDNFHLIYR